MVVCNSCYNFAGESDVFCLNCGNLLKNYEDVRFPDIDYNLTGDDFLNQIGFKFQDAVYGYENLMSDFNNSIDLYSGKMEDSTEKFTKSLISYEKHVNNIIEIFDGLSKLFSNCIVDLNDFALRYLHFSDIFWKDFANSTELTKAYEKSYDKWIESLIKVISEAKNTKSIFESFNIDYQNQNFENAKNNLSINFNKFITFHQSFVRELKFIKHKYLNNNCMTIGETHNHFCIYCGAKLGEGQNFCSQCGKAVVHEEKPVVHEEKPINVPVSKYSSEIDRINQEYDLKQSRATTLVNKLFDPNHMAYNKFSSSIEKSNELFHNQLLIARKMVELDNDDSPVIKQEIESKINTLQTFVDKMDDLINELVIQLSSNKKDEEDINNLFNDMDDLIHSVKDY